MDIEKIKQRILDLAIRGKLVPQDPNDEPASVLIEKIKAEKEKLIKEGKIKPNKNESYIYKDSDNCYYEKTGNERIDISDQIPFDIPDNWIWVRLKMVGTIIGGGTPSTSIKEYWENGEIVWITPAYMSSLTSNYIGNSYKKITKLGLDKSSAKLMPKGSIIMSSRAPIGYIGINTVEACTSQGCKSLVPFVLETNHFLFLAIKSSISRIIEASKGTTFNEISGTKFGDILIPLAPLKEQTKICRRIDKLYKSMEEIKNNVESIKADVKILKQKILDYFFGTNSSYKSYYPSKHLNELCKLSKIDISTNGSLPYLEAKFIRGLKEPTFVNSGSFVKKGSKMILVDGENSGEVMISPCDGYLCSTFKILDLNDSIDENYLMYFIQFHKEILKNNKTGSAVPHLNKKIFGTLMIPLPPLKKQKEIANRIKQFENKINKIIS